MYLLTIQFILSLLGRRYERNKYSCLEAAEGGIAMGTQCAHGLRTVCEICKASCKDRQTGTGAQPDQLVSSPNTPDAPPEDAREIKVLAIELDEIAHEEATWAWRTQQIRAKLSAYADNIRKQCADKAVATAVGLCLMSDTEDDEDARELRATIMYKGEYEL